MHDLNGWVSVTFASTRASPRDDDDDVVDDVDLDELERELCRRFHACSVAIVDVALSVDDEAAAASPRAPLPLAANAAPALTNSSAVVAAALRDRRHLRPASRGASSADAMLARLSSASAGQRSAEEPAAPYIATALVNDGLQICGDTQNSHETL